MPNDAKLGLVVGVGLVIVVAVVFFRRDVPTFATNDTRAQASSVGLGGAKAPGERVAREVPGPLVGVDVAGRLPRPLPIPSGATGEARSHVIQDGETLVSVARQYYGDGDKSTALFRANRDRLRAPDQVAPGTVLLIPDLADLALAERRGR